MAELRPCPFCKGTKLERYNENLIGQVDPAGDYFVIHCDCGCELVKHVDGLTEEYESYLASLPEITREAFWECSAGIGDKECWEMIERDWNRWEMK